MTILKGKGKVKERLCESAYVSEKESERKTRLSQRNQELSHESLFAVTPAPTIICLRRQAYELMQALA